MTLAETITAMEAELEKTKSMLGASEINLAQCRGANEELRATQAKILAERDVLVASLNTVNIRLADSHRFFGEMAEASQRAAAITTDNGENHELIADLARRLAPPSTGLVQQQGVAIDKRRNKPTGQNGDTA